MDIETIGTGAGAGGFFSALLAWLGKQRLDRIDKDISELRERIVWRDTCRVTHEAVNQRLERMENKIDTLLERQ